jgi:type III restriction enzyme
LAAYRLPHSDISRYSSAQIERLCDNGRTFVKELDTSSEVVVYAKLPKGFSIPTPVGNYNPDWAISFKEGVVKHVYFVAETKGSISSMELREIEKTKAGSRYFCESLFWASQPKQVAKT